MCAGRSNGGEPALHLVADLGTVHVTVRCNCTVTAGPGGSVVGSPMHAGGPPHTRLGR
jgi:hypothetical protein